MIEARVSETEEKRLASLHELMILDTAIEDSYEALTQLAAEICEAPISLISLVDEERQWFKSHHGLDARSTPRKLAFCAHAILEDEVFEVEDSREDERFHDNPLVIEAPNVVFCAGTQLQTPDKLNLGALCVIDHKPRQLTPFQTRALKTLGEQVSKQFELRRSVNRLAQARANQGALAMAVTYSHEINNPLAIAKGMLELGVANQDWEAIEAVEASLDRIADVVKRISNTLETEGIVLDEYADPRRSEKLSLEE